MAVQQLPVLLLAQAVVVELAELVLMALQATEETLFLQQFLDHLFFILAVEGEDLMRQPLRGSVATLQQLHKKVVLEMEEIRVGRQQQIPVVVVAEALVVFLLVQAPAAQVVQA